MRQKRKELKIIDKDQDTSPKYHPEQLRKIANQLNRIFADHKIYTNSDLTICDLASKLGTNRTYVSSSINVCYNQNFNSYVNQFRLDEMKDIILNDNDVTKKNLFPCADLGQLTP